MNKYSDKLKRPRDRSNVLSQAPKQNQKKIAEEIAYVKFFNGTWKIGRSFFFFF